MPIRLGSGDKLLILRRLDRNRTWESLDDKRYCRCCGATFIGRQVDVVGGTRGSGRLRLLCPTESCASTSQDWVYPARNSSDAAHSSRRPPMRRTIFMLWVSRACFGRCVPAPERCSNLTAARGFRSGRQTECAYKALGFRPIPEFTVRPIVRRVSYGHAGSRVTHCCRAIGRSR